jgi:ABC-type glycerol-3-phosphate transport system substrate-binding protein
MKPKTLLLLILTFSLFLDVNNSVTAHPTIIKIWQNEPDEDAKKVMEEIIKQFEEENDDYKIKLEIVKWHELASKIALAVSTNDFPAISHVKPYMVYSLYKKQLLSPITEVVEKIDKYKEGGEHKEGNIIKAVKDLHYYPNYTITDNKDKDRVKKKSANKKEYFGLPYAVGIAYFAYRKDLFNKYKEECKEGCLEKWKKVCRAELREELREECNKEIGLPTNWGEYIKFLNFFKHIFDKKKSSQFPVLVPPGDHFLTQFTLELLALSKTRLFGKKNCTPQFRSDGFLEVLKFWKDLSMVSPNEWISNNYSEQFKMFRDKKVANLPITYARALKEFDSTFDKIVKKKEIDSSNYSEILSNYYKEMDLNKNDEDKELKTVEKYANIFFDLTDEEKKEINDHPNKNYFFLAPLKSYSGKDGYSTLDSVTWVVFKKSKQVEKAKEFLKMFYEDENYLKYTQTIPIHLIPIKKNLLPKYAKNPVIARWKNWYYDALKSILNEKEWSNLKEEDDLAAQYEKGKKGKQQSYEFNKARPILILEDGDSKIPFLFEFVNSNILARTVKMVALEGVEPKAAAAIAQKRTEKLMKRLEVDTSNCPEKF